MRDYNLLKQGDEIVERSVVFFSEPGLYENTVFSVLPKIFGQVIYYNYFVQVSTKIVQVFVEAATVVRDVFPVEAVRNMAVLIDFVQYPVCVLLLGSSKYHNFVVLR